MGNNLKFNSSVCTTREQSQRLLDLGLKPETADMYIFDNEVYIGTPNVDDIPAWSLHRLIALYSDVGDASLLHIKDVSYNLLIFCIEKAIQCKFFNKEYLTEKI